MKKAIILISGGLDSALAARLVKEQGIEVIGLNFKTPFCLCNKETSDEFSDQAYRIANNVGIELKVINLADELLEIVKTPKHGYGKNLNPCIDCRILMLRKAKELMQELQADFVVTGEVLGQRPMSQYKRALNMIDKDSGLENLVLRPLSAKLLSETFAESSGWVDREKLLDLSGKIRRPQMDLAKKFNIKDYYYPAGGCLLTDSIFVRKLRDLLKYNEASLDNVELLKIGRHFRLNSKARLVVGRDIRENERLLNLAKNNDYLFDTYDVPGPVGLGKGVFNDDLIKLAGSIICYYSDVNGKPGIDILYRTGYEEKYSRLGTTAITDGQLAAFKI